MSEHSTHNPNSAADGTETPSGPLVLELDPEHPEPGMKALRSILAALVTNREELARCRVPKDGGIPELGNDPEELPPGELQEVGFTPNVFQVGRVYRIGTGGLLWPMHYSSKQDAEAAVEEFRADHESWWDLPCGLQTAGTERWPPSSLERYMLACPQMVAELVAASEEYALAEAFDAPWTEMSFKRFFAAANLFIQSCSKEEWAELFRYVYGVAAANVASGGNQKRAEELLLALRQPLS